MSAIFWPPGGHFWLPGDLFSSDPIPYLVEVGRSANNLGLEPDPVGHFRAPWRRRQAGIRLRYSPENVSKIFNGYDFLHPKVPQIQIGYHFAMGMSIMSRFLAL